MRFATLFLIVMWTIFILDAVVPGTFNNFGVVPRTTSGLIGVATMPFLHKDLAHITSNTVELIPLLLLLIIVHKDVYKILPSIAVWTGLILWVIGRNNDVVHIGASGVVYGLITYMAYKLLYEFNVLSLIVICCVLFFKGINLLAGLSPNLQHISWDGHFAGAIAGIVSVYFLKKT